MLVLRLQRTGRKKLPMYRLVAQDKRQHPSSGRVVASLGHYNPHTKESAFDKENIQKLLNNGAQPSNRTAILLQKNGIKLPDWVKIKVAVEKKKPSEETKGAEVAPAEVPAETAVEEKPAEAEKAPEAEEPADEKPASEEA